MMMMMTLMMTPMTMMRTMTDAFSIFLLLS